jgi:predicted  nucleic acid-binding Zn-ribbon protein
MPGPAAVFREIHRLRRFAHELKEQIERFPIQVRAQQAKVKRQEDAKQEATESIKKLKVTIHEKEVSLKSTNSQIKKYEGQLNDVAGKKEYDALLAEIAHARRLSQQLEDEILTAMTQVDDYTAKLPELDANVARAREEYARWEKEAKERQSEQAAQLAETSDQLKAGEAQIPDRVRPWYNRTVAAMGPDGMAAVKSHSCGACSTEITAQNYNELLQEQFVACKSCGRILYLPERATPVV